MATYYWVGGSGDWDSFNDANWSLTSGGAGGAGVPTPTDDVIFNSASGATADIVFVNGGECRNWTASGTSTVIDFDVNLVYVYGNMTLSTANGWLALTPSINFYLSGSTNTITSAGKDLGDVLFSDPNQVGGAFTLSGTFTASVRITVDGGVLNTNGVAVNTDDFTCLYPTYPVTINCGASTFNIGRGTVAGITSFAAYWTIAEIDGGSPITFNAGTSIINIGNNTDPFKFNDNTFAGGGKTYNRVNLFGLYCTVRDANTYAIFTYTGSTTSLTDGAYPAAVLLIEANQNVTGTYTVSGASINNRLLVTSDVIGTARTINIPATRTSNNVNYRDITVVGTALSGTSLGNMQGNTNITFTAPVTRYARLAGGDFSATATWSATSGGSASTTVPLPQDTVVFDINSGTVNANMGYLGGDITVNAAYTGVSAFSASNVNFSYVFGNLTLAAGKHLLPINTVGQSIVALASRTSRTITFPNDEFGNDLAIIAPNTTVTITSSTGILYIRNGAFGKRFMPICGTIALDLIRVEAGNLAVASSDGETGTVFAPQCDVSFSNSFLTFVLNNPTGNGSGTTSSLNVGYVYTVLGVPRTINFVTNPPDFELLQPTITMTNVNHFFGNAVIVPGGYGDITLNLGTYYYIRVSTNTFERFLTGGANTYNTVVVRSSATITLTNAFDNRSENNRSILFLGESTSTSIIAIASNRTAGKTNVFRSITKSGAGTLTSVGATNLGLNTGITFSVPLATYAYSTGTNLAVTSPLNAKSASVIVIGGGQAGTRNSTSTRGGAGGRAGTVAIQGNVPVNAGATFYINVGAGGANSGSSGNASWVNFTTNSTPATLSAGCVALGGNQSGTNIGSWFYVGGAGGAAAGSSGTSGAGGGSAQAWDTPAVYTGASASSGRGSGGAGVRGNGIAGNAALNAGAGGLSYTNTVAGSGADTGSTSIPAGVGATGINGGGGGGGGRYLGTPYAGSGSVRGGAGGNGSSASDLFYRRLNNINSNGFASGGGGGGGGGYSNQSSGPTLLGGDGGAGGLGGGGGGGGGGYFPNGAAGLNGNFGIGGSGLILVVYEVNAPTTQAFILGED